MASYFGQLSTTGFWRTPGAKVLKYKYKIVGNKTLNLMHINIYVFATYTLCTLIYSEKNIFRFLASISIKIVPKTSRYTLKSTKWRYFNSELFRNIAIFLAIQII